MPYLLRIVVGLLLSFFWLFNEFKIRSEKGQSPKNIKELISLGSLKTSPNKKSAALIFSSLSFFIFSIWEGLIRYMISMELSALSFAAGILLILYSLFLRLKRKTESPFRLYLEDHLLFLSGAALCFGALITFLFFPWLAWRSYLRLSSASRAASNNK